MKRGSTLFLRMAVFLIGTPVLALCVFGVPWLLKNPVNPDFAHILYPIVVGFFVSVFPFFGALYQAFKLLSYIDNNQAFSDLSVNALKKIMYCAITISSLYVLILPFVFMLAEVDDAPGLIIIGMVPVFASMVIAVFAALLRRLLKEAIDIKSENDLTV
ncbi:DUF2975 domain-containing protein [Bacillus marasmi]|uniref:DUF2975 domain-containing protein n=1 Tax=Bacillus marasmi TaxID=1926279 RepID=UPI0011CA2675|nr:DUF2975 domain-containing protein [Bacillus marasmi]